MPKPPHHPAQNQLFRQSRVQLAVWYAGVMGAILTLLGLGVYRAIAHAHEVTIDREINSVTDALHDAIEANVSSSAELNQISPQFLPDLCLSKETCTQPITGSPHRLQRTYSKTTTFALSTRRATCWQPAAFAQRDCR